MDLGLEDIHSNPYKNVSTLSGNKMCKNGKRGGKMHPEIFMFLVSSVGQIYVYLCGTFDSVCIYVWVIFFLFFIFYYLGAY